MNTFDYKQKIYGWDKQTFDDYNKSRAVTKENLVKKYGKDIGIHRWNEYLQKQHYSKTLDYLIEKYGEEKGLEEYKRICREKLLTKENFIRKYGEIDGITKWKSYLDGISCGYSKTAIKFIEKIVHANKEDHKLFYGENEKKFDIFENEFTYVLVDLYDETTNKVIEFYGDFWHANPLIYKENDVVRNGLTAKEIWNHDKKRINLLKEKFNLDVRVVWEYDSKNQNVLNDCLRWIYEYHQ